MPYRALVGLSYPPDKIVEAGYVVDDIPKQSVKWLLDQGLIEDSKNPRTVVADIIVADEEGGE